MTHWADVEAEKLLQTEGPHLFATAITPSGPIHVGNMREVITTEAIYRAAKDQSDATLLYIADDYDPLRKVYPFLEENDAGIDYEEFVGRPLREIPCPCGKHAHYAEHFLLPFLSALEELGIRPVVKSAYDMYHDGKYQAAIATSLREASKVRDIIERISGRQLPKKWAPFNPQCPACSTITGVEVTQFDDPNLHIKCPCGKEAILSIHTPGIGKLPWRLDWPARWQFLGVTFEAFGKDHGAKGGSWDTGKELVPLFGGAAPQHVMYEFLNLKGQGAMHSSTGLAVAATDVLQMTPPEVLRYLLVRQSPRKHIDFDPGLGLLNLVDEFDRLERANFGNEENVGDFVDLERTYQLSCPNETPAKQPVQVSYRHLVTVAQMAKTPAEAETILRRSKELEGTFDEASLARFEERVHHVKHWINNFAPAQVKFQVQDTLPAYKFSSDDKAFLSGLSQTLEAIEWTGQAIHDAVYEAKGERKPAEAFRALYQAILGQDRGPRAGFFLASLEKAFVLQRFVEASR